MTTCGREGHESQCLHLNYSKSERLYLGILCSRFKVKLKGASGIEPSRGALLRAFFLGLLKNALQVLTMTRVATYYTIFSYQPLSKLALKPC